MLSDRFTYCPIHIFIIFATKTARMIRSLEFQFDADIPWEDLGNGVRRQLFGYDDTVMLVKVKFEKGAIGALHEHHHTQVTYVESGAFEMTIGGQTKIIRGGDGYYVPPHVVHGVVCLEPGMLVDVFTPHRADFIR